MKAQQDIFNHLPAPKYEPPTTAAETLINYGSARLDDVQLFEVLGIPEEAARVLMGRANHDLTQLAKMTVNEISDIKHIGKAKAAAIVATFEIGRRRAMQKATEKSTMSSSLDVYEYLRPFMQDETQEIFTVIFLDRRSKLITHEIIHRGGMSAMVVDPKIIFQRALLHKACSIIVSHNHPSGATSPSIEDIRLTEKINNAGKLLDIKLLDHIIVGTGYYSFADEGKI